MTSPSPCACCAPLVLLMSGGHAPMPAATARLHASVHREAAAVYRA